MKWESRASTAMNKLVDLIKAERNTPATAYQWQPLAVELVEIANGYSIDYLLMAAVACFRAGLKEQQATMLDAHAKAFEWDDNDRLAVGVMLGEIRRPARDGAETATALALMLGPDEWFAALLVEALSTREDDNEDRS